MLGAVFKIQEDLEKLEQWVEAIMMNLNRDKYKLLHLDRKDRMHENGMIGSRKWEKNMDVLNVHNSVMQL